MELDGEKAADIRTDAHEARVSETQLAEKSDDEVQRHGKNNAEADLSKQRCDRGTKRSHRKHDHTRRKHSEYEIIINGVL